MPPKRKRPYDPDYAQPQRPTPPGNMFHWSILFPVDHWYPPPPAGGNQGDNPGPVHNNNQSFRFFEAVRKSEGTKGFLLIKQLFPLHRLLLVQDLRHTRQLLVNKRLRKYLRKSDLKTLYPDRPNFDDDFAYLGRVQLYAHPIPGDIRFARIAGRDPRVEVNLPDEPYFQRLYAYGFPHSPEQRNLDHGLVERADGLPIREEIFNASLYYEYLNGGSLEHAIMRINRPSPDRTCFVEEAFIWHAMEQLLRALIYLHYGVECSGNQRDRNAPRVPPNWQPICHRWLTMDNVMLHWPHPGQEGYDDSVYGRLPRVVMTTFDNAARVGEETHENGIMYFGRLSLPKDRIKEARYGVSPKDRMWQVEEPGPWQDIYALGKLLRRIIVDRSPRPGAGAALGEPDAERFEDVQVEEREIPDEGNDNWFDISAHSLGPYRQSRGGPYSDQLIYAILKLLGFGAGAVAAGLRLDWLGGEDMERFEENEKPPFHTLERMVEIMFEADVQVGVFREGPGPVDRDKVTIASVRPPDERLYLMPFRTRKIRERAAEEEIEKMMESLNGPSHKVLVDYGPEHENARLAKTRKERELEEKRARQEREIEERVANMFQRNPETPAVEGLQEDERRDYEGRLMIRKDRDWRDYTRRLVEKRFRKAVRPYEQERKRERKLRERMEQQEGAAAGEEESEEQRERRERYEREMEQRRQRVSKG